MNKEFKIPFLFFFLFYFNQGLFGLEDWSVYYLTRETWKLSATMLGVISFVVGFCWYIKPLFGYIISKYKKGFPAKRVLIINQCIVISCVIYILFFGYTFYTLLLLGLIMNGVMAFSDVINDYYAVKLEKQKKLNGKCQSCQWLGYGAASVIVTLVGAFIAQHLPAPYNYKCANLLFLIIPVCILFLLSRTTKFDHLIKKTIKTSSLSINWSTFKNKSFILSLMFIGFLQFSPSFGVPLTIQMREVLHIDKMFLGLLGAISAVLSVFGYWAYYKKLHRCALIKLLYFSVILSGVSTIFYLWIPNQWVILGYTILFGAFSGISFLTVCSFFAKTIPVTGTAFFYPFITGFSNLCGKGSQIFGGYLSDTLGYNSTVIISALFTLSCLLFIPFLKIDSNS